MRISGLRWTALAAGCLASVGTAPGVQGQEFRNLDFEESIIHPSESVARAPGWSFSQELEGEIPSEWIYLGRHLGDVPMQRMATDLVMLSLALPPPRDGHFSVFMAPAPDRPSTSIFPWMQQTARVPSAAMSIRFVGDQDPFDLRMNDPSRSGWHLMFDGAEIPLIELPGGILSGDVSALAGAVTTLRIAIDPTYYLDHFGYKLRTGFMFDSIRFSPLRYNVVAEPGTGLGMVIGLVALAARPRRQRAPGLDYHEAAV